MKAKKHSLARYLMPVLCNLQDRPFGHQGRRDDEHFADAYMPQRYGSWEYYRGKAARDECCNRLPRKDALKLAKRYVLSS